MLTSKGPFLPLLGLFSVALSLQQGHFRQAPDPGPSKSRRLPGTDNMDASYHDYKTEEEDYSGGDGDDFLKANVLLMNGAKEQIRKLSREQIIQTLWAIEKVDLPAGMKQAVWEAVKGNRSAGELQRETLEAMGRILLSISERDLYDLNVSDWRIVEYLGSLSGLSRRQAGVVAFALRNRWGNDLLEDPALLNRIKGLICGFSPHDLSTISTDVFGGLTEEVFGNLGPCTPRQKRVLLETATSFQTYGPPQVWTGNDTETLGLLVTAMDKEDMSKIRPEAMEGLAPKTMEALGLEQLEKFTDEQIEYLTDLSLAVYRKKMGIPSNRAIRNGVCSFWALFVAVRTS